MAEYDPHDSTPQDKSREGKRDAEKLAALAEAEDVRWLMGSKRGRRIVWRLLSQAGVFQLSFNTNSMTMAFAEGRRNEGLHLFALVNQHSPEHYPVMVKEANE